MVFGFNINNIILLCTLLTNYYADDSIVEAYVIIVTLEIENAGIILLLNWMFLKNRHGTIDCKLLQ